MGERNILLVEDEVLIRFVLGDALRDAGYNVLEASNGDEGLAFLYSGHAVDLMITDVRMPGEIDGMELTRRSKSIAPDRPVIVCSGHLLPSESEPADIFFPKPYSADALIEAIIQLMGISWQRDPQTRGS